MLPSKNRLSKTSDFKELALKGRPFYSSFLTLKILKESGLTSRFGVVVSARVSKKATVRNKIKRRITEIVRLNLNNLSAGFKIMIFLKPAAASKNYREIKEEIGKLLKQARIL